MKRLIIFLLFLIPLVSHAQPIGGPVRIQPSTYDGLLTFKSIDLDETEEAVDANPGKMFGYYFYNKNTTDTMYVRLYDASVATVIVGTTVPKLTIPVPPLSPANVFGDIGIEFFTAITAACTSAVADDDVTAPGLNDCIVNIYYK